MARGAHAWVNGEFVPTEKATINLFSHALHYGTGVFEGVRAYEQHDGTGAVFLLREHIRRLFESWKILGLTLPYSEQELVDACLELCRKNNFKECYLRPIAFIGEGPLGIDLGPEPPVQVAIISWEWGRYLGDEGVNNGIRLKVSSYIRPHVNSVMTKGKINGQYVYSVLAKREAKELGYDEALFLDKDGFLTEGSGENLFMIRDGKVKTTPLTSILNGFTRQKIIHLLQEEKGIPVQETRFTRDELYCADEAFLTGTAAEVTPIRDIDNRVLGYADAAGKPGPITQEIQKLYGDIIRGKGPKYTQEWLTKI